jgi:hypothetical protein
MRAGWLNLNALKSQVTAVPVISLHEPSALRFLGFKLSGVLTRGVCTECRHIGYTT